MRIRQITKWAAVISVAIPLLAHAERNVYFTADFESGRIQPYGGHRDSFYVKTLPDPQEGREVIRTGAGGGSPSAPWDSKVVRRLTLGGQEVLPRQGEFFARLALYYEKDYRDLNGGTKEKPRAAFAAGHDDNRIAFDTETWAGISIFVPKTFEHETGTRGMADALLYLNTDSSATFLTLQIYVPRDKNKAHWFLQYAINDDTVREKDRLYKADLGPVEPDIGKWTDFVLRFRSNPFSVDTNPAKIGIADAFSKLYEGNKGILQLWKSEGQEDQNGNRQMVRKINLVNTPVGNVPGTTSGKSELGFSIRIYKWAWQTKETDVKGPIIYGFDEFRFGQVQRDGTTFADVHPAGLDCRKDCSAESENGTGTQAAPLPPEGVTIAQ